MSDEKIKISWDEVNSAEVDSRLKQQSAILRAQQHFQQVQPAHSGASPGFGAPPPAVPQQRTSIWYNTVFYMAVFGAIGGLFAWVGGEVTELIIPNYFRDWQDVLIQGQKIIERRNRGELTYDQADAQMQRNVEEHEGNPYLDIVRDKSLSDSQKDSRLEQQLEKDKTRNRLQDLLWFATLAIVIGFFLSVADQAVGRNVHGVIVSGSIGIVLGLVGGIIVGLFINDLYSALGGGQAENLGRQVMARTIGWAILGLFLAIAPGVVLRNWKRLVIGLAGGCLGGLIGGLCFDLIGRWTGSGIASRAFGIVAIGLVAGVGTGLIEAAAKTGWFKVVAGLIAGKQFILYKNPTHIGSSPQCEIYLFKDPQIAPRHAAILLVPGGFDIEDLRSVGGTFINGQPISRARLRNNDQVQIGSTVFSFQERHSSK